MNKLYVKVSKIINLRRAAYFTVTRNKKAKILPGQSGARLGVVSVKGEGNEIEVVTIKQGDILSFVLPGLRTKKTHRRRICDFVTRELGSELSGHLTIDFLH